MKKTNKTFKRFAAITSASLLAACAVAPAVTSAAEITINETEKGHKYSAYQIFNATVDASGTLTGITWGSGVNATVVEGTNNDLLDKLNALEFKVGETDVFDGLSDAAAVANAISAIGEDGQANTYGIMDEIADIFEMYKTGTPETASYVEGEGYKLEIDDDATGYYLVVDGKDADSSDGYKTASKYILKVVGNTAISVKKDAPTVMKKIKENNDYTGNPTFEETEMNDAGYNDTADYCIGDYVPFKLYGSLPSTLANYQGAYKYVFHDTLEEMFNAPTNVVVKISVGDTWYYVKGVEGVTDITGYKATYNGNDIDISFADIKNVNLYTDAGCTTIAQVEIPDTDPVEHENIRPNADSVVTVEYVAQLNSNAKIGRPGQKNSVYLEYANDSNFDGAGDVPTTNTEIDTVIAFTYEIDLTKVDGSDTSTKLKDAKFVLKREVNGVTQYAVLDTDGKTIKDWVSTEEVTINTTDGTISIPDGKTWTATNAPIVTNLVPTVVTTPDNGTFSFIGLDDDTYELLEIKAPAGYKIPDNGKSFTLIIEADTTNGQTGKGVDADGTALVSLKLTKGSETTDLLDTDTNVTPDDGDATNDTVGDGKLATQITNTSSSTLPGTGGIGTTIFYLGGGAMAAIGGVYLISKRRMKKSEE